MTPTFRTSKRMQGTRGTVLSVLEDLEARLQMSATLLGHARVCEVSALTVTTAKKTLTPTKTTTKTTTATTTIPTIPDPSITDPSIAYASFSKEPLFAPGGPKESDINQGDIGDCFFLATLASVAKVDPKLITQDITANTDGSYTVKLDAGKTVDTVRVDNQLPIFSDGQLAYAGLGTDNCLWVAVMEKAYAVMRTGADSYASLNGGWMTDALGALGVKSANIFTAASATALFKTLAADAKAGDSLTYGTNEDIIDKAPLIGGHAYTIDAVTLDKKGNPVSMTLRNPWGNACANDGEVTLTVKQAIDNFMGLTVGIL